MRQFDEDTKDEGQLQRQRCNVLVREKIRERHKDGETITKAEIEM